MSGRAARASKARKRERKAALPPRRFCVIREVSPVITFIIGGQLKQAAFMSIAAKIMEEMNEMERAHDPQR